MNSKFYLIWLHQDSNIIFYTIFFIVSMEFVLFSTFTPIFPQSLFLLLSFCPLTAMHFSSSVCVHVYIYTHICVCLYNHAYIQTLKVSSILIFQQISFGVYWVAAKDRRINTILCCPPGIYKLPGETKTSVQLHALCFIGVTV